MLLLLDNNYQLVMEPMNYQFNSVFKTIDGNAPSLSYSDIFRGVSEMIYFVITVNIVTKLFLL